MKYALISILALCVSGCAVDPAAAGRFRYLNACLQYKGATDIANYMERQEECIDYYNRSRIRPLPRRAPVFASNN